MYPLLRWKYRRRTLRCGLTARRARCYHGLLRGETRTASTTLHGFRHRVYRPDETENLRHSGQPRGAKVHGFFNVLPGTSCPHRACAGMRIPSPVSQLPPASSTHGPYQPLAALLPCRPPGGDEDGPDTTLQAPSTTGSPSSMSRERSRWGQCTQGRERSRFFGGSRVSRTSDRDVPSEYGTSGRTLVTLL